MCHSPYRISTFQMPYGLRLTILVCTELYSTVQYVYTAVCCPQEGQQRGSFEGWGGLLVTTSAFSSCTSILNDWQRFLLTANLEGKSVISQTKINSNEMSWNVMGRSKKIKIVNDLLTEMVVEEASKKKQVLFLASVQCSAVIENEFIAVGIVLFRFHSGMLHQLRGQSSCVQDDADLQYINS